MSHECVHQALVGERGISYSGAYAAVTSLADGLKVLRLVGRVSPEVGAHAAVKPFARGLGEAVGDGLEQQVAVGVGLGFKLMPYFRADGHSKASYIVAFRRHEIAQGKPFLASLSRFLAGSGYGGYRCCDGAVGACGRIESRLAEHGCSE